MMDKVKVILISGSRNIMNRGLIQARIRQIIESTSEFRNTGGKILFIHGGASGVDYEVSRTTEGYLGVSVQQYLPNYSVYGKSAPIIRNKEMVKVADEVYVIWDGVSAGTLSVIDYARKLRKPIQVYKV